MLYTKSNNIFLLKEVCKNDNTLSVTKSEIQQSVITTIASNNKILVNSLNKTNDKGILIILICYL